MYIYIYISMTSEYILLSFALHILIYWREVISQVTFFLGQCLDDITILGRYHYIQKMALPQCYGNIAIYHILWAYHPNVCPISYNDMLKNEIPLTIVKIYPYFAAIYIVETKLPIIIKNINFWYKYIKAILPQCT